MHRRRFCQGVVAVAAGVALGGCGRDGDGDGDGAVGGGGAVADVQLLSTGARQVSTADPSIAGAATTAFGTDLLGATRGLPASDGRNVVVSPVSVAVALAMVEPGAVGDARTQLHHLLRIDDPATFHPSMNALGQSLESRVPFEGDVGEHPGEITVGIANAAYLQQGYPFEQPYLDAIGASYGPVLDAVDFAADPDAVAHQINGFVAEVTHDRIPDLVPDGTLTVDTVLALVNALYLKASWVAVFDAAATVDGPFTTAAGTPVAIPLMHGGSDSSAAGDGWVGATKAYVGQLSAQFVLPDDGRFDEVADGLASVFADYDEARSGGVELVVPRFESRFHADLPDALRALGLTAPFEPGHLLGIADDDRLELSQVIHETFVAVDEEGTEAAAATVVTGIATSAPVNPPVPVILDRPFLFRILDEPTGATLFIGQVLDPS